MRIYNLLKFFFFWLRINTVMYKELILCLILWSFILKPLKHLLILYINYHIDTLSKKNTSCMLLVILKLHHYCFQWPKSCNQTMLGSLFVSTWYWQLSFRGAVQNLQWAKTREMQNILVVQNKLVGVDIDIINLKIWKGIMWMCLLGELWPQCRSLSSA